MPSRMTTGFLTLLCLVQTGFAQDTPSFPSAQDEHKWLQRFVGHWEVENSGSMGEGQPEMVTKGTIDSEMLGGFWIMNRMTADFGGIGFKGVQTVGYDADKKKYVGTWIDSTNGFMWKYEGFVDKSGRKLVLEATGPDMTAPGKMRQYRDSYEFKTDDLVITTSSMKNDDGTWNTFMKGTGKRVTKDK